jgi:hypothetical protein
MVKLNAACCAGAMTPDADTPSLEGLTPEVDNTGVTVGGCGVESLEQLDSNHKTSQTANAKRLLISIPFSG